MSLPGGHIQSPARIPLGSGALALLLLLLLGAEALDDAAAVGGSDGAAPPVAAGATGDCGCNKDAGAPSTAACGRPVVLKAGKDLKCLRILKQNMLVSYAWSASGS